MAVAIAIQIQRCGDYKALLLSEAGLVGFWRLNEAVGATTVADLSGNGFTGTKNGTVTFGQATPQPDNAGGALFDGSTGSISVADAAGLHVGDVGSVECWLKRTSVGLASARVIVEGGANALELTIETDDKIKIAKNGVGQIVKSTTAIADTNWHHVVYTKNGATSKIYLDGLDVTGTVTNQTLANVNGLVFASSGAASFLPATLEGVAYYNVALSAAQVTKHYLSGQWTDVSADRAHRNGAPMQLTGGMPGTTPADLVAGSGEWHFELRNDARNAWGLQGAYSPDHANCLIGWQIGIRVRCGLTIGANPTYYKWQGWITDIEPLPGLFDDQTVDVRATDWMDIAGGALAAGIATLANQRGDQAAASIIALAPIPPLATSFDTFQDTYPYVFDDLDPTSSSLAQALDSLARSGLDRFYIKGDTVTGGVLKGESRWTREAYTPDTFVLADTPPDSAHPALALAGLQIARKRGSVLNQVLMTIHPRRVDASTVVLYSLVPNANTFIEANSTVVIQAPYVDPNQAAQQIGASSVVTPVSTTDYTANSAADASGTDLTASLALSIQKNATAAQITIANTHPTLRAYLTKLQVRGIGLYGYQAVICPATSTTSQNAAGQNVLTIDMAYQPNMINAALAAAYLLNNRSGVTLSQVDQVVVTCPAIDEASLWQLVQCEVSTPIGLTETMSGLNDLGFWIEHVDLQVDERDHFVFTFEVSPRDPTLYWTLGIAGASELGLTTVLAAF
jgi:hypothetical protein